MCKLRKNKKQHPLNKRNRESEKIINGCFLRLFFTSNIVRVGVVSRVVRVLMT